MSKVSKSKKSNKNNTRNAQSAPINTPSVAVAEPPVAIETQPESNPIPREVSRITDRAVLVNIAIGMPGVVRTDKALTGKIHADYSMDKEAGQYKKLRFPPNALKEIQSLATEARSNFHYDQTLPWSDEGYRILPAVKILDYLRKIGEYKARFEELVTKFGENYQSFVDWAKEKHNGSFDPSEYPGAEIEKQKFYFRINTVPIPSGADFRIQMETDALKEMVASVDERVKQAVENARVDLWKRLEQPVKSLVERMEYANNPANRANLHKSMFTNIKAICDAIPSLNITEDKNLETLKDEIEKTLCSIDVETLKDERVFDPQAGDFRRVSAKAARDEVKQKADDILARMRGYFQP
jgi:hypothetical protein